MAVPEPGCKLQAVRLWNPLPGDVSGTIRIPASKGVTVQGQRAEHSVIYDTSWRQDKKVSCK